MHPAKSVIFFTTASGAGYGLIAWLSIAFLFNLVPVDSAYGLLSFAISFALIVGGLLSSTFHLGHPERAWRAMSQWRSSWLSREGLAAVLSFAPMGLLGLHWLWPQIELLKTIAPVMAVGSLFFALFTIYCTAMIYASLKSIPAWHNPWTILSYLSLALMSGALLMAFLTAVFAYQASHLFVLIGLASLLVGLMVKLTYWSAIGSKPPVSTSGTATGLAKFGTVTLLEAPHSTDNYLLEEMGFKVARKHAKRLRQIAIIAGFIAPLLLLALAVIMHNQGQNTPLHMVLLFAGLLMSGIGLVVERWLFFAQAKHVVTLYYGETAI